MNNKWFIEPDFFQKQKHGQTAPGDIFLTRKHPYENRMLSLLSDGLGSGIKANVLAALTASMGMQFVVNDIGIRRTAEIIMRTLPICRERRISYSTFTLVDTDHDRTVRIVEYDNPPFLLIRDGKRVDVDSENVPVKNAEGKEVYLKYSRFQAEIGDRVIFFSDGVTQSGMGSPSFPLGWGIDGASEYILKTIMKDEQISARDLSRKIVSKSWGHDQYHAKDDITSAVIYFRKPRNTLIMTGPPFNPDKDHMLADYADSYDGKKVVCGGTTANIISREMERKVTVNIRDYDPDIPPSSTMDGFDLITEGILTLGRVSELLENNITQDYPRKNAATKLLDLILDSDIIHFLVGTRINEAHQDPNMPVELEIRRNIIKKIAGILEKKFLKETYIEYI